PRQGLCRSLSRRGDHDADARAPCAWVHLGELAKARRRSLWPREHVARRSLLVRDPVPRLEGAGWPAVDVADPRDLRSADGAPAADLAAARGLEARRRSDQCARRPEQAALNKLVGKARMVWATGVADRPAAGLAGLDDHCHRPADPVGPYMTTAMP